MSYIQKVELMQGKNTTFIHTASLDTSKTSVTISEPFDTVLYIIDLTTDDIIYNPLHKGRGGVVGSDSVLLDYPMTNLSDTDDILVVVDIKDTKVIESELNEILEQTRINNIHLSMITGDEIADSGKR